MIKEKTRTNEPRQEKEGDGEKGKRTPGKAVRADAPSKKEETRRKPQLITGKRV